MIEKFINYINDKNKAYVIFDIGSRDCQQSIEFYKTFPNAKIYAFECNPNTLNLCEENIIPYQDRITLIKGAVCDYDGSITFYPINQEKTKTTWKDGNPGASSLFKSNGKYTVETYVQDEITTNCHRLDTIMNKHNIPCVDIIWMDLQGAELLALKGLGNKLSSVEYLYTEVSHKEMYTGQIMYKELNDYMIKNNFSILNNLSLSGWQEDVVYKKNVMNSIKINNYTVIVDCFFSMKYNSLVVITNNRTNIFKKTGINISDIEFKLNNEKIELRSIDVKDFVHLEGENHKKGVFKENFHIDVLCKKGIFTGSKNNSLDIIVHDTIYTFNLNPPDQKFINSKCLTTIFKDEYHRINEWVDYHKQIGFEYFIIYDNSEKKENINIENVEIISANWDYWQNDSNGCPSSIGHVIQQNHCLWKYSPKVLGLTDLDEFINVHNFDIFNFKDSVISIPNYFFNYNTNIYDSLYREKNQADYSPHHRKCIVKSKEVDLFCVHIPINFKNIYYCKYNEVQLNHLINLSTKKRNKNKEVVYDNTINLNCGKSDFKDIETTFDIAIPVGPNDKSVIEQQIKYTKKNIIGYRNIYLICYDPSITFDGCITINENIFPFSIQTVAEHHGKLQRNGWYLQQLLKLYAGKIIPNILDKYLVIDSDTFFLKPTTFVENNKCLYNYGTEYHKPYFHHMKKLDKDLVKIDKSKSGICHHMIFETKYIDELIAKIEKNHNDLFYNVFLKTVTDKEGSGASEYEIYFNYMLKYYSDKIKIRKLNWKNTNKLETNSNFDYISYHWYMRMKLTIFFTFYIFLMTFFLLILFPLASNAVFVHTHI